MSSESKLARKIQEQARDRNRELVGEIMMKTALGLLFSVFAFTFVFLFGCFIGGTVSRSLGLHAWQVGLAITVLYAAAATIAAWYKVEPLRDVSHLSESDVAQMLVSQAVGLPAFSPRHATAGIATLLIGGPASVLEGLGLWASRLRLDAAILDEAVRLLIACEDRCPATAVRRPHAAILLRRLGLVKIVSDGVVPSLALTDRGFTMLAKTKRKAARGEKRQGVDQAQAREEEDPDDSDAMPGDSRRRF